MLTRTVYVGSQGRDLVPKAEDRVFVFVKINDAGGLSITGVVGPKSNGDGGSCGQIIDVVEDMGMDDTLKLSNHDRDTLVRIWRKWHLNHMQAGTPLQMEALREHAEEYVPGTNHFDWANKLLFSLGLNPDNTHLPDGTTGTPKGVLGGFQYGHAWLKADLPKDVVDFLTLLPNNPEMCPAKWRIK